MKIPKFTKQFNNLITLLILTIFVFASCGNSGDGSPGAPDSNTPQFVVKNLPRSDYAIDGKKPDQFRTYFVTFSIATDQADKEYRIGVRSATEDAPTAQQLVDSSAAITRTLSTSPINLFIPYHMDATFGDTITFEQAEANILSPNTNYTVYVADPNEGTAIAWDVLDFKTDSEPTNGITLYGAPRGGYDYTVRLSDNFLFRFRSTSTVGIDINNDGGSIVTILFSGSAPGGMPGYSIPLAPNTGIYYIVRLYDPAEDSLTYDNFIIKDSSSADQTDEFNLILQTP